MKSRVAAAAVRGGAIGNEGSASADPKAVDVVMSDNRDGRRIAASKNVPEGSCRCLNQLFLRMSALVGLSSVVPQFEIEQPSTLGRNGAC
jgi:hypothetical protein